MNDRTRWNDKYRSGEGPDKRNPRLDKYRGLLKRGRALDLAGGLGQNRTLLEDWTVINVDIADEALKRSRGFRVLADANVLPFAPGTFDTIICTNFLAPKTEYAALLTLGGTIFFETFTLADQKYRPDFNPAFLLDPAQIPIMFREFETILCEETDSGRRVFLTYVGRKNSPRRHGE